MRKTSFIRVAILDSIGTLAIVLGILGKNLHVEGAPILQSGTFQSVCIAVGVVLYGLAAAILIAEVRKRDPPHPRPR